MKPTTRWTIPLAALLTPAAAAQVISVVGSPHDLSAGGPGPVRATIEDQVCIFCHTPHNASPIAPLWNRAASPQAYQVYTSRALDARPTQPTGTSKLCLSCHDGTVALGSVLSRPTPISMSGGVTTMPQGKPSNLGTDLRNDHPISFRYDSALASANGKLRDPSLLAHDLRLDSNRELQCTTCHDAHNNAFGSFLVRRNNSSELCISCHTMGTTDIAGHAQCADCHQPHSAPSGPYLLRRKTTSQTCLACHDGSNPQALNVSLDTHKAHPHDNNSPVDPERPMAAMDCAACHEPHTMRHAVGATPPSLSGPRRTGFERLGRIGGVSLAGTTLAAATAEHEVCMKCHAEGTLVVPTIPRRQAQPNMRVQFNPSAVSFHPVGGPGRSTEVPSLKPGWSTASTMQCSDCHASDSGATAGEHGSALAGLLVSRLTTADRTSESAANYALCYRCHDRGSILNNQSFSQHRRHIVEERTPCTVCHDSHGIGSANGTVAGNSHLINFATNVVFADRVTGRLEYRDTGPYSGQCFLSCHGENHNGLTYHR